MQNCSHCGEVERQGGGPKRWVKEGIAAKLQLISLQCSSEVNNPLFAELQHLHRVPRQPPHVETWMKEGDLVVQQQEEQSLVARGAGKQRTLISMNTQQLFGPMGKVELSPAISIHKKDAGIEEYVGLGIVHDFPNDGMRIVEVMSKIRSAFPACTPCQTIRTRERSRGRASDR